MLELLGQAGKTTAFARELIDLATRAGGQTATPEAPVSSSETAEPESEAAGLSPREVEVLRLLAEGLSNKEIAQRLYITVRTVKYHTTNIFTKLNVDNRTQAVMRAKAGGIF